MSFRKTRYPAHVFEFERVVVGRIYTLRCSTGGLGRHVEVCFGGSQLGIDVAGRSNVVLD